MNGWSNEWMNESIPFLLFISTTIIIIIIFVIQIIIMFIISIIFGDNGFLKTFFRLCQYLYGGLQWK